LSPFTRDGKNSNPSRVDDGTYLHRQSRLAPAASRENWLNASVSPHAGENSQDGGEPFFAESRELGGLLQDQIVDFVQRLMMSEGNSIPAER
jgi:hypothetical protein